ncbi:LysR substrate-binding domain-containing protein [Pollutimonas bauzanensis]|uniref:Transcriptional regulator, LysR family n=1 Tax=Pollutimonas bauzanensis TaxID=658167 RepID=A0A1M5XVZ2_9BURK|nr:LysR substrate-binding domain-containing protein [Pollutimonas bauzanensis]SHI04005.1 transcriptional regulator, LysR family [Pollutimonas bauzanensis]
MNIRQLEAFRATVLVGTVNGAASLLGVSQPSISRLISQLEKSLTVVLFDRANGRLVLTPEGRMIYEQVEHTFSAVDKIREFASDIQNTRIGNLSIACMPALGLGFLPSVIHDFCAEHPNVSISLDIQVSPKIEDWIVAQHIDFGLAQLPFNRDDIVVDDFCNIPYYAVLPRDHPLAGRAALHPKDFDGLPFISLTRSNSVRHLVDQFFSTHEVNRVMRLETSYLSAVCKLVQAGLGVGLADPFSVQDHIDGVVARLMSPSVDFRVGLMYASHRPLSKVGRAFITFLKQRRDELMNNVLVAAGRGGKSRGK